MKQVFPNTLALIHFQDLQDNVSQEGCPDELVLCNKDDLEKLYSYIDSFSDETVKEKLDLLYKSKKDYDAYHPLTVAGYKEFVDLEECIRDLEET